MEYIIYTSSHFNISQCCISIILYKWSNQVDYFKFVIVTIMRDIFSRYNLHNRILGNSQRHLVLSFNILNSLKLKNINNACLSSLPLDSVREST